MTFPLWLIGTFQVRDLPLGTGTVIWGSFLLR